MQIKHIPNQPILFEDDSFSNQPCINNDDIFYAQLMQTGDSLCVQMKLDCDNVDCGSPEIETNIRVGELINLIDWTEYDTTSSYPIYTVGTSPPTYWKVIGGEVASDITAPYNTGIGADLINTGNPILIAFDYDFKTNSIASPDYLFVGLINNSGGLYRDFVIQDDTTYKNIDGRFTIILDSTSLNEFFVWTYQTNNVGFKNLKVVEFIDLCVDINSLVGDQTSDQVRFTNINWQYVESCNGWQCKNDSVPLVTTFELKNNKSYLIKFKVQGLQINESITAQSSGCYIKTATENGEYVINYTHTCADDYLEFISNKAGVGMIVYDFSFCEICYNTRFALYNQQGNRFTDWYDNVDVDHPVNYFNDRLIWCFSLNNMRQVNGDPLDMSNENCFYFYLGYEQCDPNGGRLDPVFSTTKIQWNASGHPCSSLVEGICDNYAWGFYFGDINNPDFTLRQRLRILHFNPKYRVSAQDYLFGSGNRIKSYSESTKERELWIDYVDEPTHDVISIQILSDKLLINNIEYYNVIEDYEPLWAENGKRNLAQSVITLISSKRPTIFNRSC